MKVPNFITTTWKPVLGWAVVVAFFGTAYTRFKPITEGSEVWMFATCATWTEKDAVDPETKKAGKMKTCTRFNPMKIYEVGKGPTNIPDGSAQIGVREKIDG